MGLRQLIAAGANWKPLGRHHRWGCSLFTTAAENTVLPGNEGVSACMLAILDQHKALLTTIDDPTYTFQSPLLQASIGQHTRHSLDHLRKPLELLTQRQQAEETAQMINYDLRQRNTAIEHDRLAAIKQIDAIVDQIHDIDIEAITQPIQAAFMLSANGTEFAFPSTFCREMAFAVHHCIHHNALTKVLLRHHFPDIQVPVDFGMAPSTANYTSQLHK